MPSGRPLGLIGKRYDYFEAEEVTMFFGAIPEARTDHNLMFALPAYGGLRIGEVTGEFKRVKLKTGEIHITNIPPLRRSDIVLDRKILKIQGKGNKRRDVTFADEPKVLEAITRHIERYNPKDIMLICPDGKRKGKPYTPHQAWRLMKKYCIKAGIKRPWSGPGAASPHLFRHTYATHQLMNGRNIQWVQMQLGHNDIATTQIYSNLAAVGMARQDDGVKKLPY